VRGRAEPSKPRHNRPFGSILSFDFKSLSEFEPDRYYWENRTLDEPVKHTNAINRINLVLFNQLSILTQFINALA
jgi:hypothetical protein